MHKQLQILVYVGGDDPTRGDSHGLKGIGAALAAELSGEFHYVEDRLLGDFYPHSGTGERRSSADKLKLYFTARGYPDIVLSSSNMYDVKDAMGEKEPQLCLPWYNESFAKTYLDGSPVVANHLTSELLKDEGRKFRQVYPNLPSPLIAVMLDQYYSLAHAEKLLSKCAAYPQATIFLCGSWRSGLAAQELHSFLLNLRHQNSPAGRVRIEQYSFHPRKGVRGSYNPYIGLLNEADHVIVMSNRSYSLLSEPLAAGKPAIFTAGKSMRTEHLEKNGLVVDFNDCSWNAPFETARIAPISTAREIAVKIAAQYKAKMTAA